LNGVSLATLERHFDANLTGVRGAVAEGCTVGDGERCLIVEFGVVAKLQVEAATDHLAGYTGQGLRCANATIDTAVHDLQPADGPSVFFDTKQSQSRNNAVECRGHSLAGLALRLAFRNKHNWDNV
jgi:hypothetical protein